MTTQETVTAAVAAFHAHPNADDDAIAEQLSTLGVPDAEATKLIQFVPIAFCRFVMRPSGVKFAPHYVLMDSKGRIVGQHPLDAEPVFTEALAFCDIYLAEGHDPALIVAVAARSAGYQAVMKLLADGARPQAILTSPPIMQAPDPPKPKWWPFRR